MNKGFTLIELLVVVLIIGVLSSVALPQYTKAVEKARTAEVTTLMGDIMTGEQAYRLAHSEYTDDLESLDIEVPGASNNTFSTRNFSGSVEIGSGGEVLAVATRNGSSSVSGYQLAISMTPQGEIARMCNNNGAGVNMCDSMPNDWENVTQSASTNKEEKKEKIVVEEKKILYR